MTRDDMIRAYAAPGRHYHDLRHIEDCLAQLDHIAGLDARDRAILTEAIWWHDIVYDPMRSDNEERSADLAEQAVAPELRAEVGRLIRLTRTHDVASVDRLGAILISIDLSILGADDAAYDAYATAIRREYGHVPDQAYRAAGDLSGCTFCRAVRAEGAGEHRARTGVAARGVTTQIAAAASASIRSLLK
jgi:predicted metal-dependent HD superfamily phosphohydrolase